MEEDDGNYVPSRASQPLELRCITCECVERAGVVREELGLEALSRSLRTVSGFHDISLRCSLSGESWCSAARQDLRRTAQPERGTLRSCCAVDMALKEDWGCSLPKSEHLISRVLARTVDRPNRALLDGRSERFKDFVVLEDFG
ncbi:hypothetical protein AOLI_G00100140 [Acnodon oligacanthus]